MPFEVPEGWCWCKLEDIAQSNIGLTYKPADVTTNGTPVLRSNNIQNNKLCLDDVVRVTTEIRTNQFVSKGDLLICARNGSRRLVGKCALINTLDEQCSFGAFMAVCKSLYNEWLFYVLCSTYFSQYLDDSNSTTIYQVTQKMLLDLPIPFPPLKEQKRIAAEIEKYINLIDLLEESKHDLNSAIFQTKSKILDLAIHGKLVPQDANDEPASELLKRINPKAPASCDNPHYGNIPNGWIMLKGKYLYESMKSTKPTEDFFKYIDIDSIDNKKGIVTVPKVLPSNNAPSRASRYTCQGDVLFSMVRPYLRNIAIVPENNCIASTGFFVCHPIPVMTSEFCYYLMKSSYIVDGLNQFMKGDNSPSINNANITEWIYPIPPIEEQNRIVQKINELYGTIDYITEALL